MVNALDGKVTHNDLMSYLVCSLDNRECMLQRCENCPSSDVLKEYLTNLFEESDDDDVITYQQWQTTDRCNLVTMASTIDEYVEHLIGKLEKLTSHSYLAKTQA